MLAPQNANFLPASARGEFVFSTPELLRVIDRAVRLLISASQRQKDADTLSMLEFGALCCI